MRHLAQRTKNQPDAEFRYVYESDEVVIKHAVRELGRMEEAKRWYLEGKE